VSIDLDDLTIRSASRQLAAGRISAPELLEAVLDRVDATEPVLHAYCAIDREAAREASRQADETPPAGPLHGIPFGAKDVFWTEGLPTTCGSRSLEGWQAPVDAAAVHRLRSAGAVLVGKQVTHEFACGQDVPATRNAWQPLDYPGGSSAGSAVSVAIGSSLAAIGTDAGGSVRKPAALNGLTGFKPTRGLVPRLGIAQPSGSLDHVGTFARTVEDTALLLEALAGLPPLELDDEGVRGLRVGLCAAFFGDELEPGVRAAVEEALRELARLGVQPVPVELPSLPLALPAGFTILTAEAGAGRGAHVSRHAEDVVPETRQLIELGAIMPGRWADAAQRARARFRADVRAAFVEGRLDVLVTPTLPRVSMPVAEMVIPRDLPGYIPFTMPWNLTGQPALTVPCGIVPDEHGGPGRPVGLQIVGRPFDEVTVLRLGHAYQGATDWHERRPPLPTV
jgi:aspartyl-tRNA(Asn)/glutamyl-tRNA(Gln) amidotransferase subunit A